MDPTIYRLVSVTVIRNVPLISDDILIRGEPSAVWREERGEGGGGPPACHSGGGEGAGRHQRGAPRRGHNPTKLWMEFAQIS